MLTILARYAWKQKNGKWFSIIKVCNKLQTKNFLISLNTGPLWQFDKPRDYLYIYKVTNI